jgi:ribonuclease P protein component
VLPVRFRLRDSEQISTTVRRGTRAARRYIVVHYLDASAATNLTDLSELSVTTCGNLGNVAASGGLHVTATTHLSPPPRVGLAVNKAVGGSVARHRVARKIRHVVANHVEQLPDGCSIVVRALPAAAEATSAELDADFTILMSRVTPCY